jgi:hypothetical protein
MAFVIDVKLSLQRGTTNWKIAATIWSNS